jgi:AcrR family transcriptional regulator
VPMPKRSETYMEERRRQIVQAAVRCIIQQGWARTTVDEVAAASGLSKGAVYNHFPNKRAILAGLLEAGELKVRAQADIASFDELRAVLLEELDSLGGPEPWLASLGSMEAVIEGVRDDELRSRVHASNRMAIETFEAVIGRLRPELNSRQLRIQVLALLVFLGGVVYYQAASHPLTREEVAALLDERLDVLKSTPGG